MNLISENCVAAETLPINEQHLESLFVSNFGMSSEQFKRELEAEFEQASPKEQAEFKQLVDQVNEVVPEMNGRLDRVSEKIKGMRSEMAELRNSMSSLADRLGQIEVSLEGEDKQ